MRLTSAHRHGISGPMRVRARGPSGPGRSGGLTRRFAVAWLTLGPFDNENKAGFPRVFEPENQLLAPIDVGRTYEGKERPVRYRVAPGTPQYGWFDFGDFMRPRENVCGYATTFLRAKKGTR